MPASQIVVKLKIKRFNELAEQQGWSTDREIAKHFGLDQSTVSRVRRGTTNPGSAFIDACLRAFGATSYTELFIRES